ncbi:LPS translocon maturation chaperone LptM [Kaarinaea lacus]
MSHYRYRSVNIFAVVAILFSLLSGGMLSGCGQKGALYLPDEKQKQESEKEKKKKTETEAETKDETENNQ